MHAAFQQLEVDYFLGPPDTRIAQTDLAEVPILRMYGVSEAGPPSAQAASSCAQCNCVHN